MFQNVPLNVSGKPELCCLSVAECSVAASAFDEDPPQNPKGMNFARRKEMEMASRPEHRASDVASDAVDAGTPTKRKSGVFKLLVEQHGEAFALAKRLGTRSEQQLPRDSNESSRDWRQAHERHEMVEVHAALRAVVEAELSREGDTNASDLFDTVAALDAINPSSPEWDPTFLQLSELVEARVNAEQSEFLPPSNEAQPLLATG